ncbi:peptidase S41 [Leptolyngbya valderiana BDU 20041]|nr:S41 family peptidase [Geitlerinema sp. CS-897]OAB61798.1 peptidase S41 [Leptolyngbya valderiana BDU 20041]PPT10890.1 carboxyl-terminal protease [Geitlerinema sp. FC II]
MNRSSDLSSWNKAAAIGGAIVTTTLSLLSPTWSRSSYAALETSPKAVLDEVWQIVNRDYVDGEFNQNDWQAVRQELLSRDYTSREQAYAALRRALSQLDDPYTRFLDPEEFEALNNQTSGELSGVGLRLERNDRDRHLTVVEPLPNSPASREGLRPGDSVMAIDGEPTRDMSVDRAATLIRGAVGTPVTLTLSRSGRNFDITLVRSRIELPAVTHTLRLEGDTRIGYIRLSEFTSHAHEQMYRAIEDLKQENVEAFVLDLRGNPGGLVDVSVQITRMWLDRGSIVQMVDRYGNRENIEATHTALTERPLAVLVDGHSASASEILAGALQDHGRATVIGSQTFGKALVQSVNTLSDGSGLAVTVAHYYTPHGTDISHRGISPDIRVRMTGEEELLLSVDPNLLGTHSDPFYARAIDLLQTQVPIASK